MDICDALDDGTFFYLRLAFNHPSLVTRVYFTWTGVSLRALEFPHGKSVFYNEFWRILSKWPGRVIP